MTLHSSFSRIASFCLSASIVALLAAPLGVLAAGSYPFDEDDSEITDALDYLRDAQDSDGSIGGFAISAWAVMAISAAGEDPGDWDDGGDTIVEYLEAEAENQIDDFEATDWARMIPAIVAADEDPTDFGGEDYVAGLEALYEDDSESGLRQIGDDTLLNDDFWGVLALVAAGESVDDEIIDFILEYQNDDGGWTQDVDVDGSDDSDVDNTAAAIMALRAAGESSSSDAIQDALDFLAAVQNEDGGFPQLEGDDSNAASDAWAIMALEAAGEDPDGLDWQKDGDSAVYHLLFLQASGGYFEYEDGDASNEEWMTSYAIPALLGMPYPVEPQFSSSSGGDPEIGYDDADIEFMATVDGDDPLDREFVIWNEGDGTLDWEVSDDAVWLSLSPSSGSSTGEDDEVTISIDTGGLAVDTYSAEITITSDDADNSPRTVDVVLEILEASSGDEIVFFPESFDFEADIDDGDPDDQVLELWNSCEDPGSLDWELEVDCDEDWLDVSSDDGSSSGEHDGVTLSVDIGDLDPDTYEATITVSWDGGEEDIDVTLEVTGELEDEEPEIDFSPSKFSFEAVEGEDDPDDEVLTIWNSGLDVLQWTLTDDATWLTLSPRNGTSEDEDDEEEVDVMVDISDLEEGEYEAEITIKDSDASNSPETVKVTLTIEASEDGDEGSAEGYYQLYAMTNPPMGGTITRSVLPEAAGYPADTSITLTAVPAMGYAFTGWSGDAAGATNPITLGMTAIRNVTASFLRFDAAGASNIALTYASPGMASVTIIPYPISSIPSSPSGFRLMSAYVVQPQGTGSFSLTFDGLADAANVGVFKVVEGMWAQVPRTVMSDTSLQITLPADDPILALAYPGSTGNDIAEKIKGLFEGTDPTVMIVVGVAVVVVILVVVLLFFFAGGRRDGY
ncbi:MAG: terpene cyclase/mutase family protein [Dehalococcoidia bacterium]|nr:terpene cyclase/mutase family protein [Dehalococcoidia bacterium]